MHPKTDKKMKVINKIVDLQNELFDRRKEGKEIGLVPTMGALHEGHASLVKRSVKENGVTVVSVFLNPTQFNDKGDLERYPRTLDADCKLLEACGADYVFAPSVEEMYPTPDTRHFEFPPVSTVMEGAKRPGHFNGVCQVVSRLFYIVRPTRAYFGEKDWQQIAVIKQLVKYHQQLMCRLWSVLSSVMRMAWLRAAAILCSLPDERAIAPDYLQGSEGERGVCQESYRAGDSRQGGERHQRRRGTGGRVFPDCGWRQPAGCGFMGGERLRGRLHHRILRQDSYPSHRPYQV